MERKISKFPKYLKILALLLFAEFLNMPLQANPGDTTVVTVWNLRKLTQYGNYDTVANFPTGKRYRKIRMHYILGRYACPGNPQYCGSWDYTTQIFARPANNDSVEIARVITPYATDWLALNKKHDYVVEVTDYASVLQGLTGMRFNYSGYSWGFTITLKIEFIEGVPPMDALKVKNVYNGYFPFGNATNTIENYLVPKTFSYSTTGPVYLKNTISGHGSDNTGCAEFCNKYYQLNINNNLVAQRQIWRNDCGINEVYPQTGTWIYNRGGWCPGAVVWPIYHNLSSVTNPNSTFSLNIDMQSYFGGGSLGGYNYESQLITYSAPNHSRDVSLEDIVAPTNDPNYVRRNPRCNNPIVRIRNTGTSTVTSVEFAYQVNNGPVTTHTWSGSLNYLDTTSVVFPPNGTMFSGTVTAAFHVSITAVNNQNADENLLNNDYHSTFSPVLTLPESFVVKFLTNQAAGENEWTIYDDNDIAIFTSQAYNNATLYKDTMFGLFPGCYRLTITDIGCNGLNWWAAPAQGSGSLRIERLNGNSLFVFPTDFGCEFTKYFVVRAPNPPPVDTTPVSEIGAEANTIEVFPSPAAGTAYLKLDLDRPQTITYRIQDINGRQISSKTLSKVDAMYEKIDVSNLSDGLYFVQISLENQTSVTKKLVVTH